LEPAAHAQLLAVPVQVLLRGLPEALQAQAAQRPGEAQQALKAELQGLHSVRLRGEAEALTARLSATAELGAEESQEISGLAL
jgi:hypothetical protein